MTPYGNLQSNRLNAIGVLMSILKNMPSIMGFSVDN